MLTRHYWKRLAWLTSQYLNYAFLLQVSIDFFSKSKFDNISCLSTGGQYFIIWSLKFKGHCSTLTQFPFANYHLLCWVLTFSLPKIIIYISFINNFVLYCLCRLSHHHSVFWNAANHVKHITGQISRMIIIQMNNLGIGWTWVSNLVFCHLWNHLPSNWTQRISNFFPELSLQLNFPQLSNSDWKLIGPFTLEI